MIHDEPTDVLPSTEAKIRIMQARAAARQPLSLKGDARLADDIALELEMSGNGIPVGRKMVRERLETKAGDKKLSLAARLLLSRKRAGYSIKRLAKSSGVHYQTIRRIESYKLLPSLRTLQKLSKAMGIEVSELV